MVYSRNIIFGLILVFSWAQISVALIGEQCISSRCPNNEEGAMCVNNICTCIPGKIQSDDRTKCLTVATSVGDPCESEQQCTNGLTSYATCGIDTRRCVCKPEATVVGQICQKKKYLNEQCYLDQECRHIDKAVCTNNICTCGIQHVPSANNSVCLPLVVSWLAPCEEPIQCSTSFGDNAYCKDMKLCACKENYHPGSEVGQSPLPTTCVRNIGLTESCKRSEDCYLPRDGDTQHTECFDSKCRCKDDKKPSQDNQSCSGTGLAAHFSLFWAAALVLASTMRG